MAAPVTWQELLDTWSVSSDLLRQVRQQLGLTQHAIAVRMDVTPCTWSRWECGTSPIKHERILALALGYLLYEREPGV